MRNSGLKILISAYACNPFKGSEEGVGWGWVRMISGHHETHVITADFHRNDVEKWRKSNPEFSDSLKFHYVSHKPWHYRPNGFWKGVENSMFKPLMNCSYTIWLRDAFSLARRLNDREKFDLAHQLTYVGFRFPGHLWKLDIPFVWGPVGGLENTPWRFLPSLGLYGMLYYAGRNVINTFHKLFLRGPKQAFRKADGSVIAATEGIRKEIKKWYGVDSYVISEIGPPPEIADAPSLRSPDEPLRIAWSGLHLPGKALHFLLKALSLLSHDINWQLDILGEGPLTEKWKRLARKLGIERHCTWHGWKPRNDALRVVHSSHVFVITSMKDLTSTVILEALSQGVPVICPDHCGFSNVITGDCGIKIPLESPKQLVRGIAGAVESLYYNEAERRRLARGALERVRDFSWEKKAEVLDRIYRDALKKQTRSSK